MLVDDEDFDLLIKKSWSLNGQGYPVAWHQGKTKKAHRLIIETQNGLVTDHINGNKLDNRKSNLRLVTQSQNCQNQSIRKSKKTSKFKGVCWHKNNKTWTAYITGTPSKIKHLGSFKSEQVAAEAYNKAARILFKENARLNQI